MARPRIPRPLWGSAAAAALTLLTGCGSPPQAVQPPPCRGTCWQAAITAAFTAINRLDCDYGYDYFGGEDCIDDFNDVNRAPRWLLTKHLPNGMWLIRVAVDETTGITDTFDVTVSADGRREIHTAAYRKKP